MSFPRQLKIYTASWGNIGDVDEELKVQWNDNFVPPLGLMPTNGNVNFIVGTDCFLESPTNMTQVNDEQLIASLSMNAILAGEILPGTSEYIDAVTGQGTKYLQSIIGNVTLKSITRVSDPVIGPEGTVYDIEFQKVGQASNVKTVRMDAWAASMYSNRVNNVLIPIQCIPGAVHKQFGFKKSQLGPAESANRNAVIDYIQNTYFWI
jgi:hypothetical protein